MRVLAVFMLLAGVARPQDQLTIRQAVDTALTRHPAADAGAAGSRAAHARVAQARGSLLPRVNYTESWQRSNNPVYAFGSLLNQRQFTSANFEIDSLNHPGFLNNFQSQVTLDQTIYDNGVRKSQIATAHLGDELASEENRKIEIEVIAGVLKSYYAAIVHNENVRVAEEAVKSAEADLHRAENRRAAGLATDADVLAVRVHVAAMRDQQIRRGFELELARAELNQAMGLPLDTRFQLMTALKAIESPQLDGGQLENEAAASRPETREAGLAVKVADEQRKAARAAMLPELYFRAGFEADRQRFIDRGGANWLASAGLRWSLFNGFADRARVEEIRQEVGRRSAQARLAESYVRLDARRARLELQSAAERIAVTQATIAMAEETLRIVRNRYEGGLTDVTELLRTETVLLEARSRELEAIRDQMLAAVAVESARGKLNRNSELVNR